MTDWREQLAQHLQAKTVKSGTVSHSVVRHDSWCALLNSRGDCTCNPDVEHDVSLASIYGPKNEAG